MFCGFFASAQRLKEELNEEAISSSLRQCLILRMAGVLLTYQMRCFCLLGVGLLRGAQREDRNEAAVTYPSVLSENSWQALLGCMDYCTINSRQSSEKKLFRQSMLWISTFNLTGNWASFWKCHVLQPRAGDTCLHAASLGGPKARPAVLAGESSSDVKLELSGFPWLSGLIADTRSTLKWRVNLSKKSQTAKSDLWCGRYHL